MRPTPPDTSVLPPPAGRPTCATTVRTDRTSHRQQGWPIKGVAHPGAHEAIIEQVLWEGVQAKLSTHVSKQRKGRAESPGDAINAVLAAASYNQVAEVLWLTTP